MVKKPLAIALALILLGAGLLFSETLRLAPNNGMLPFQAEHVTRLSQWQGLVRAGVLPRLDSIPGGYVYMQGQLITRAETVYFIGFSGKIRGSALLRVGSFFPTSFGSQVAYLLEFDSSPGSQKPPFIPVGTWIPQLP